MYAITRKRSNVHLILNNLSTAHLIYIIGVCHFE